MTVTFKVTRVLHGIYVIILCCDYGGIDTKIEFVSFVLDEIHLVTFERLRLVEIPFRIVDYILTHM